MRKAISLATVTLGITQYKDDEGVVHIDITQTLTGGINGSQENRAADWTERDHTDHIFGHVIGQSRMVKAVEKGGKFGPDLEIQTKVGVAEEDEAAAKFLRGETLKDGSATEGFVAGADDVFMQSWVRSVDNGWTAEQVCRACLQGDKDQAKSNRRMIRSGPSKPLTVNVVTPAALSSPGRDRSRKSG